MVDVPVTHELAELAGCVEQDQRPVEDARRYVDAGGLQFGRKGTAMSIGRDHDRRGASLDTVAQITTDGPRELRLVLVELDDVFARGNRCVCSHDRHPGL